MKKKLVSLLFTLLLPLSMLGQTVGVKTNLLHWASVTPNMAVEVGLAKHVTAELYGAYNSFRIIKKGHTKWKHWFVQPEVRYWTCEKFNGFFVGVHAMGGQFNMVGFKVPPIAYSFNDSYLDKLHNYRYEGDFVGGGISLGYQFVISPRWNIELSLGGGYNHVWYRQFEPNMCGARIDPIGKDGKYPKYTGEANYVGPTKATISFVFFLN